MLKSLKRSNTDIITKQEEPWNQITRICIVESKDENQSYKIQTKEHHGME